MRPPVCGVSSRRGVMATVGLVVLVVAVAPVWGLRPEEDTVLEATTSVSRRHQNSRPVPRRPAASFVEVPPTLASSELQATVTARSGGEAFAVASTDALASGGENVEANAKPLDTPASPELQAKDAAHSDGEVLAVASNDALASDGEDAEANAEPPATRASSELQATVTARSGGEAFAFASTDALASGGENVEANAEPLDTPASPELQAKDAAHSGGEVLAVASNAHRPDDHMALALVSNGRRSVVEDSMVEIRGARGGDAHDGQAETGRTVDLDSERSFSNPPDGIVFVCRSLCVKCRDGRSVFIRRSKTRQNNALLSGAVMVLGAGAVKAVDIYYKRYGRFESVESLWNMCQGVQVSAFEGGNESSLTIPADAVAAQGAEAGKEPNIITSNEIEQLPPDHLYHRLSWFMKDLDSVFKVTDNGQRYPGLQSKDLLNLFDTTDMFCKNNGRTQLIFEEDMGQGFWNYLWKESPMWNVCRAESGTTSY